MSYIYNLLKQFLAFLLNTTDKYVGNFGISITIVTILIKILLLPLTLKQDKSMKEMKKLQPELEKIKQKYPDSLIDPTGHSLGGYLAMVVAIRNRWETTVFNAPDPSNMLSEKEIKWARANTHLLVNYRNYRDAIGNFGGNPLGIARYVNMGLAEDDVFIPKDTVRSRCIK